MTPSRNMDGISCLYGKDNRPLSSRNETVRAMKALMGESAEESHVQRPSLANVYGEGPTLLSDIPSACRSEGVCLGIDEAGRGSVLGPMVYGAAYWNTSDLQKIPKDFNDSKQLSDETRTKLLNKILHDVPEIGFAVRVLHASEISRNMLRKEPYNLNAMSHDSAIGIIRKLIKAGVKITTCYIDTVGIADHYKRRLESEFPGLDFVVESKADAKYAPCSAASVVAKVVRDRMIENWCFSESNLVASKGFGSGYPSDPTCKKWMEDHQNCKVFGFCDVVRFSWNPIKKTLEEKGAKVVFESDIDEEENQFKAGVKRQQDQMSAFLGKPANQKQKRLPYFERKGIQMVTTLR